MSIIQVDFDVPKVRGLALKTLAERVEEGLRDSEWFVTGVVDAAIFSEGFVFKDDSVSTKGIRFVPEACVVVEITVTAYCEEGGL